MKNFGIGLALGLIGAILWRVVSGINSALELFSIIATKFSGIFGPDEEIAVSASDLPLFSGKFAFISMMDAMYLGLVLMIAALLVYWVILPIVEARKRRRE